MGSRLHGNDGRRRRTPQSSFPRRRESTAGRRRWVPVSTGTTGRRRRTPQSSFPRRREWVPRERRAAAMGSRLHGNDGPAAMGSRLHGNRHPRTTAHPTIVIPATAGIHGGGPAAMGSRLHGNDGRRRAHPTIVTAPQSSFPRRRESTAGAGDGFPSPRERRAGDGRTPQSSFPRRRESTAGAGDGFPSPRERRAATAHPTIVIPATAGIHGGGEAAMGSRLHGNDGPAAAHPTIVIPATAPRPHNRLSRDGGNPRRGGRRWVPVSTGTTGGGAPHNRRRRESTAPHNDGRRRAHRHSRNGGNPRPHNRHSRDGGNPRRGAAGDGFPSPRERRAGAAHPTIVIPAGGRRRTQRAASGNWRPL